MVRDDNLIELDMTVKASFNLIISGVIVTPANRLGQSRDYRI